MKLLLLAAALLLLYLWRREPERLPAVEDEAVSVLTDPYLEVVARAA